MHQLLIATTNPGKQKELLSLLHSLSIDLVTPRQFHLHLNIAETGSSYAENARIKALAFSLASGLLALSDDTGLEVDALNGAPGLYSARYLDDPHATDGDRRRKLLRELAGFPRPWQAHFSCAAVLVHPDGRSWIGNGRCEGEIIPEEHGANGFGYDPVFRLSSVDKTMAELSLQEKNLFSHRAHAIHDLLDRVDGNLERLFS
jgi:XTP/dITP diphosphohydrolase